MLCVCVCVCVGGGGEGGGGADLIEKIQSSLIETKQTLRMIKNWWFLPWTPEINHNHLSIILLLDPLHVLLYEGLIDIHFKVSRTAVKMLIME